MKTNIHICSYARDFRYLFYGLRSIVKFMSGFNEITLLIPTRDIPIFMQSIPNDLKDKLGNFIKVIYFDEWECCIMNIKFYVLTLIVQMQITFYI